MIYWNVEVHENMRNLDHMLTRTSIGIMGYERPGKRCESVQFNLIEKKPLELSCKDDDGSYISKLTKVGIKSGDCFDAQSIHLERGTYKLMSADGDQKLRSPYTDGAAITHLEIHNNLDKPINLIWMNYKGEQVPIRAIMPGTTFGHFTEAGSIFMIKDKENDKPIWYVTAVNKPETPLILE